MIHIIEIMANESSVPYFNWFAEESQKHPDIKLTFIALYPERPQMLDDMKERGCECFWIPFNDLKRKRNIINSIIKLFILFKKIKPDVVHTHLFDDTLPGLIAAKLAGIKARVITKQDTGFHWNFKPQYVFFDKLNNSMATHIHTVATENNRFVLEKESAPPNKVHLIRNGFPYQLLTTSDEKTISELKNQYELNNRFVVGTVARLIEWKGHQLIIEAAENLIQKHPDLKFIWAGTGDNKYKDLLLKIIKEKKLHNHIVFTDWLDRKKMPSLYKSMDMYLHPAIDEPFGFAIAEAMMNQIPIASTKTGSTDLVTHKKEGFILRNKNIMDIIDAVAFYRNNPQEKQHIAEAGHIHSKKHLAFENMWNEHIALYKNAVISK